MKKLLFIGGGDWALEIYNWLSSVEGYNTVWKFSGVLDVTDQLCGCLKDFYLGKEDDYLIDENSLFVCTITDPRLKKRVVNKMKQRGAEFLTIVHSSAIVADNVKLGEGNIVSPFVYIANDSSLGNFVGINVGSLIGHNVIIGDFSQVNSNCDITGHVQIGANCFLGASVCIIPGIKITNNIKLGAGSVVIKNIKKENGSYFGNPAKEIIF